MKFKILILSLALTQTIGCGSGIPVQKATEGSSTDPSPTPTPTYSLDLVAIQGGNTVASGKNATDSANPFNCVASQPIVNNFFKAAKKVAFGIVDDRFLCGNCQIKIKCVPGTTVSIDGIIWTPATSTPGGVLTQRDNNACPTNGEIDLPTATIGGTNQEYVRFTLTSGSESDVEYFTCVDPG